MNKYQLELTHIEISEGWRKFRNDGKVELLNNLPSP